jgi:hypothetical protein
MARVAKSRDAPSRSTYIQYQIFHVQAQKLFFALPDARNRARDVAISAELSLLKNYAR